MVPAEIVTRTVAMLANTLPQPLHFGDKLITRHVSKISVHGATVPNGAFNW
jgi:hypothetical protein